MRGTGGYSSGTRWNVRKRFPQDRQRKARMPMISVTPSNQVRVNEGRVLLHPHRGQAGLQSFTSGRACSGSVTALAGPRSVSGRIIVGPVWQAPRACHSVRRCKSHQAPKTRVLS